jgi:hypothetical protein
VCVDASGKVKFDKDDPQINAKHRQTQIDAEFERLAHGTPEPPADNVPE